LRNIPRFQRRQQQRLQGPGPRRRRASGAGLAVAAAVAVTAAVAGCSVAPPGAAGTSPAIGPVRAGAAVKDFGAFPIPDVWNGKDFRFYENLVEAKVSKKPHNFRIIAHADLVFWLSCIGPGTAQFSSPALHFHWSVPCGNGADPAAVNFSPRATAVGHAVDAVVTASPGVRWEARIDVPAPPGVTTAPTPDPTAS
jgi:hypothetical protein